MRCSAEAYLDAKEADAARREAERALALDPGTRRRRRLDSCSPR